MHRWLQGSSQIANQHTAHNTQHIAHSTQHTAHSRGREHSSWGGSKTFWRDQWQQVTVTCACVLSNVSELIHLVLSHPSVLTDTTGRSGALAHQQLPDFILQHERKMSQNW